MNRKPGGSFAPPMSDEKLALYASIASSAGAEVGDAMRQLLVCVNAWWEQPESTGSGFFYELDKPIQAALFDSIPWTRELDSMAVLFETLPIGDLRNAAHHLLWFARELDSDREPMTRDKVFTEEELAALDAGKAKHITQ